MERYEIRRWRDGGVGEGGDDDVDGDDDDDDNEVDVDVGVEDLPASDPKILSYSPSLMTSIQY